MTAKTRSKNEPKTNILREFIFVEKLKSQKIEHIDIKSTKLEELRRCHLKHACVQYSFLSASDPKVMPGYDFRIQKVGVFFAKQTPSQRYKMLNKVLGKLNFLVNLLGSSN